MTKVADDASVSAGDQIGFTVEIANAGPGTAHAAFATDTLPGAGWTIESQDGGWKIEAGVLSFAGDLADGASSSVHVIRDSTPEDCGTVTNTVTVGAANEDPRGDRQRHGVGLDRRRLPGHHGREDCRREPHRCG